MCLNRFLLSWQAQSSIRCWLQHFPKDCKPWTCWKLMWTIPANVNVPLLFNRVCKPDVSNKYPIAWIPSFLLTSTSVFLTPDNNAPKSARNSYGKEYIVLGSLVGMLSQTKSPLHRGTMCSTGWRILFLCRPFRESQRQSEERTSKVKKRMRGKPGMA